MGSNPETLGIGTTAATADELVGVGGEMIPGPGLTVVCGVTGIVVGPTRADTGSSARGGSWPTMSTVQVDQRESMDVSPIGKEYKALCMTVKLFPGMGVFGMLLHPNLDDSSAFGYGWASSVRFRGRQPSPAPLALKPISQ